MTDQDSNQVTFIDASPTNAVTDIKAEMAFFTDKLGFSVNFGEGDPPGYAVLGRSPVAIHLMPAEATGNGGTGRGAGRGVGGGNGSITVKGIDALYAEFVANGVTMTRELFTDPQAGIKGFVLQDPEGNELGFVELQNN